MYTGKDHHGDQGMTRCGRVGLCIYMPIYNRRTHSSLKIHSPLPKLWSPTLRSGKPLKAEGRNQCLGYIYNLAVKPTQHLFST